MLNLLNRIDTFLNNITMYRLILYYLSALLLIAAFLSFFGVFSFSPFALIFSTAFLLAVSWLTNTIFAETFGVPANTESLYISALILALILQPPKTLNDLFFLFWAAVLTMASKFIINIKHKHLFNPVAVAVFLTAFFLNQSANWWVGNLWLMVPVIVGGFLIVRKIRRVDLVMSFLVTAFATIFVLSLLKGVSVIATLQETFFYSPILFFAFVMLTEPLTTPPTKKLQMMYGALVGFLSAPQIHIGHFYTTPEIALLMGNIFSYAVSPKERLVLKLKEKLQISPDVWDFIFTPDMPMKYTAGQYMEWTLGHNAVDNRGNRRYLTLASSPTENELRIGVKISVEKSSSFKKKLVALNPGDEVIAGQLSGDFTLPADPKQKLVFIAGGIGITPFRSMIKYLVDRNQPRIITLFFANKVPADVVYQDVWTEAQEKIGVKTVFTVTEATNLPAGWTGHTGRINAEMITQEVPDFAERMFYLSGPHAMVMAYEQVLAQMGVPKAQVKVDYFPGL